MNKQIDSKPEVRKIVELLDSIVGLKADAASKEEKRQVNVRLSSLPFALLEQLSERLGESRTSLAQHLLEAAIIDACDTLGVETASKETLARAAAL